MLRALILVLPALALSAGGASGRPAGGTPAVFISVEGASQLVGVELTTGSVVARIRVPSGPRDVTFYGARHLLVVSPRAGALTLVDSFEERVLHVWRGFGRPSAVATEGGYAYVTDEERDLLAVIDLSTRKVVERIDVGSRPRSVAVGDLALVAHGRAQVHVTAVDLHRPRGPKRIARLPVPGPAFDISEQPDSNLAYLTNGERGGVGAIQTTGRIRWWRPVGGFTHSVHFDYYRGRRLWVTDRDEGTVLALASHRNGRVLRRLPGCPGARGVSLVGDAWVVAACRGANALGFWSKRTWRRTLVPIGRAPYGVAEVVLP